MGSGKCYSAPFPPTTVKVADFPSGNSFNVMVLPDKKKAL